MCVIYEWRVANNRTEKQRAKIYYFKRVGLYDWLLI